MNKIRKGDEVLVIAGRDKGRRGTVVKVLDDGHVVVEGVNMVKRHTKPSTKNRQGGILEKELSIHVSNVMLLDPKKAEPTRVSWFASGSRSPASCSRIKRSNGLFCWNERMT